MGGINSKWLYLVVLSLIWGSSFILIKKALLGLTPCQLGALRVVITGLILFAMGFKTIKTIKPQLTLGLFAPPQGLEPWTYGLTVRRSNQLS